MISRHIIAWAAAALAQGTASEVAAPVQNGPGVSGPALPSPTQAELDQAANTAQINWVSCLQDQALRLTLEAVDAGASPPSSSVVFAACEEEEATFVHAAGAATREVDSPEVRLAIRTRQEPSINELIRGTYAGYDHR